MIYHCKRSTKTISNHDILTSDFKKFLSNLFDLWNGVQVHRDWSQIYHSLVRIINDFQFVNPMPACPSALSKITEGWQGDFAQSIVFSYYKIFLVNSLLLSGAAGARQPGAQRHCSAAAQRRRVPGTTAWITAGMAMKHMASTGMNDLTFTGSYWRPLKT